MAAKAMAKAAVKAVPTPQSERPERIYYKIGEVAELIGVKPHVLRYWETEFSALKPAKSKSQQRLYRGRDLEILSQIKHLLYAERMTIEGARKRLREVLKVDSRQAELPLDERRYRSALVRIKKELESIHKLLA